MIPAHRADTFPKSAPVASSFPFARNDGGPGSEAEGTREAHKRPNDRIGHFTVVLSEIPHDQDGQGQDSQHQFHAARIPPPRAQGNYRRECSRFIVNRPASLQSRFQIAGTKVLSGRSLPPLAPSSASSYGDVSPEWPKDSGQCVSRLSTFRTCGCDSRNRAYCCPALVTGTGLPGKAPPPRLQT